MSSRRHKNILLPGCREAKPGLSGLFVSYIWWQPSLSRSWRTSCRTNRVHHGRTQVWGIRAPALQPLVLRWIEPLQKHLMKEDRQGRTVEPSSASLRVEKQMTCYFFNSLFFIDVVNQYPACYTSMPCNGFRTAALNNITLCTEHKHHMWSMDVVLQPLSCHSVSVLVRCLSLIIWSQTMQSLFCQKKHR